MLKPQRSQEWKFGGAKSTAARGAPNPGRGGRKAGRRRRRPRRPARSQRRRPGRRTGASQHGPGRPPASPLPAPAGGMGVPRPAKGRRPGPASPAARRAARRGARAPHLESGGAVGRGRRNLPQRHRRHRKWKAETGTGGRTGSRV